MFAMDYYLDLINNFIAANMENLLLAILVLSVIILIAFISINMRLAKITKKYRELTEGAEGKNLEELILAQGKNIKELQIELTELKNSVVQLQEFSRETISKVYFKRYNAFPDMGSDLSFSVALLNDNNTGVLITSIYGRDENRVYLKPIVEGTSSYTLSPEEEEVVKRCISA